MEEKFIEFLKKNKVKKAFEESLNVGVPLGEYLDKVVPEDYIQSAFVWMKTKEGHAFWHDLSKKWRALVGEGVAA
jgi:hypothetical protein